MKAVVSWEDAQGTMHRWQVAYDADDAEGDAAAAGPSSP